MSTSMREEIRLGPLAIRFLVEGEDSNGGDGFPRFGLQLHLGT